MQIKGLIQAIIIASSMAIPALGLAKVQGGADRERNQATDSMHQDTLANIVNRNQDNVAADPSTIFDNEWYKRIIISGVIEPTAITGFGRRPVNGINPTPGVPGTSPGSTAPSQALVLNAAAIYLDAQVTDYLLTHITFAFETNYNDASGFSRGRDGRSQPQTLFVEEATATLANFEKSPLWLTAGRQFLLFGSMQHNAVTAPFTQTLASANNVAVTAGYVSSATGLNANVYGFQGPQPAADAAGNTASMSIRGFGGNVGLTKTLKQVAYNLNVGMINNMNNNYLVGNNSWGQGGGANSYHRSVPAVSVHIDAASGRYQFIGDYVTALSQFSPLDLPRGVGNSTATSPPGGPAGPGPSLTEGARPWAYSLEGKYGFNTRLMSRTYESKVFAGFQQSGDAVGVQNPNLLDGYWMPEYRYLAGYGVSFIKNLQVRLQYSYDVDYRRSHGGSGKANNVVFTDVKFIF
jgi:hypothetical protein